MSDKWHVVKVEGSWGTEYFIQDKTTGHTLRDVDGLTFRTTDGNKADDRCKEANKETNESGS